MRRRDRASSSVVAWVLTSAAACASPASPRSGATAETTTDSTPGFMFHHECYNSMNFALHFGTPAELGKQMTEDFATRTRPEDLLKAFETRVGRGRTRKGTATNLDGLLRRDVYGEVHRVLFIPWDADLAAYILFMRNTVDGCKLDDLHFR